jgi:hypothetical protein
MAAEKVHGPSETEEKNCTTSQTIMIALQQPQPNLTMV